MYSLMNNRLGRRIVVPALAGTMLAACGSASVAAAEDAAGGMALTAGHATAATAPGMLAAGQTGPRSAVPWGKVGPGWELAQYSEHSAGDLHPKAGATILYLVDPAGGRYQMYRWSASVAAPGLIDWSGDKTRALLSAARTVVQITLATGKVSRFRIGNAAALGYTRPHGLAVLADREFNGASQIVRYGLNGALQKVLATAGSALESPGGTRVVVSSPSGLRLVTNAGHTVRVLRAGYGKAGCQPVRWWNSRAVLAACAEKATGRTQLWRVPVGGGSPSTLTPWRHGTGPDPLGDVNAWQLSSGLYLQSPTGCSSMRIVKQAAGVATAVKIPGTTGDDNHVLGARGARLLVQARTGCMGSDSLLWFNPGTRAVQMLIKAPKTIQGVVSAIPFYIKPVKV
jgi:TolB protein